ncbi:hypothetical protein [Alcaligenes faecalis]|uniref:hypothetical protein n=1 Tax=Alcaligenes faecalis TaxID=511 RepID=UPI00131D4DAB|nr:hypothetical protein [Alcaligenes faecalis]
MIFLVIVSNTRTVPAGSGHGNLGLIPYTQFEFQGRYPGASSRRSIMGHGEDHLTYQTARHGACTPVVMPYQTTAAKRCASGIQASAASPVRTRIFRPTSQVEIERLKAKSICSGPEHIYHPTPEKRPDKQLSFIITRGTLKEAI